MVIVEESTPASRSTWGIDEDSAAVGAVLAVWAKAMAKMVSLRSLNILCLRDSNAVDRVTSEMARSWRMMMRSAVLDGLFIRFLNELYEVKYFQIIPK